MVPREELHTCHLKGKKKKKKRRRRRLMVTAAAAAVEEEDPGARSSSPMPGGAAGAQEQEPRIPDLPNYFNNLDENNRLQDAKERSASDSAVRGWINHPRSSTTTVAADLLLLAIGISCYPSFFFSNKQAVAT